MFHSVMKATTKKINRYYILAHSRMKIYHPSRHYWKCDWIYVYNNHITIYESRGRNLLTLFLNSSSQCFPIPPPLVTKQAFWVTMSTNSFRTWKFSTGGHSVRVDIHHMTASSGRPWGGGIGGRRGVQAGVRSDSSRLNTKSARVCMCINQTETDYG